MSISSISVLHARKQTETPPKIVNVWMDSSSKWLLSMNLARHAVRNALPARFRTINALNAQLLRIERSPFHNANAKMGFMIPNLL